MAPIKSSLARTVGKLLGISKNTDLSLRGNVQSNSCLLYTSPSPRDPKTSRMPSSA